MRSRAVSRPFLCCDSMAFAPPPWRICSSSFLIFVNKSTIRRVFFSNSGDLRLAVVFRTEADTREPREAARSQKIMRITKRKEPVRQYKRFAMRCANRTGLLAFVEKCKVFCADSEAG